ncbi:hypothetical protein DRE_01541 [Drechslerella stenobrocha 248]|uniref:Calcineurin-like phosphoesterase domain-containing protein n=1 Tax=Drechslerella stenobrocha 248 TaxID=1043628 RepID=W7HKW0_9PEZI|nr:hypothetical protein DRE_01541 [Drechslerella stenobrocha 248]
MPPVRIVCISDTHNDDRRADIPDGDIFIHAGDMTDWGTLTELQDAYNWISSLPHKLKIVVAGNHDFGLDADHPRYVPEAVELFTSDAAKAAGIHYLNQQVQTFTDYTSDSPGELRVYGNPRQPEFLGKPYAFIYRPFPFEGSVEAWKDAPTSNDNVDIWVMHSPPYGRLDAITAKYKGLTGCQVQVRKIAAAKPLLCVFGHYHFSWGVERVRWEEDGDGVSSSEFLSLSPERKLEEGRDGPESVSEFSFPQLERGRETIFVNAACMTMNKASEDRNKPIVINLSL